ncbi:MAG TPA: HEAT repeat domain-containing protein, partial [Vicinamibacterales bacterium]|nr:HEAT repeat domain-containing protein [Vicinamibacterales bacterium]
MLTFLAESAAALDETPWMQADTARPILASEVFVDLDVLTRPSEPEPGASGREERHVVEVDAARYELPPMVTQMHRLRWSQLMRSPERRVLKGAPGSGKSFLSRHAAVVRLRRAHEDLSAQRTDLAGVPVTLWVSASAIAEARSGTIAQALASAAERTFDRVAPLRSNVRGWLETRLLDRSACIVIDAVDEVNPEKYGVFQRRLRDIAALPGQLIVTCRTLQWEILKHEIQPLVSAEEVELAPLTPVQLRLMIERLFLDSNAAAPVVAALHQNRGLRHACTTPLRLLLVCLLARDGRLTPTTTYAGLYTHLLRALIEGRWRAYRPRWTSKSVRVEHTIAALTQIGWALFETAPANNRFNLSAWTKAAARADGSVPGARLLEDLVALGVLVPAGFDELGDRCWSFAHRTLLEYLAARNLAELSADEWLEQVRGHFWFQPEWTEVLTFLAAIVPDATPLIIALDREEDDIFGSMLELRAQLVGVARRVSTARARRVAMQVFALTLEHHRTEILPARRLERCVRALGYSFLGPLLEIVVKTHSGDLQRRDAVLAFGDLEPTQAVPALGDALADDVSDFVRAAAAEALGKIGVPDTLLPLLVALESDPSPSVRHASVGALRHLADVRAVQPLLQALHSDTDPGVRRAAAQAISIIAPDEALDALLDVVCRDRDAYVRRAAADQLGKFAATQAVPALVRAFFVPAGDEPPGTQEAGSGMFPSERARQSIVRALGNIGGSEAVSALVDIIRDDPNPQVRRSLSGALWKLVATDTYASLVVPLIPRLSGDANARWRRQAAAGLGGFPGALDALVNALCTDSDTDVRLEAAFSLGPLVESKPVGDVALRSLIDALRLDSEPTVRIAVAHALWRRQQATASLIATMRTDVDGGVRGAAAWILGESGDRRAIAALIETLQSDPDSIPRANIAEALAKLAPVDALQPLLGALQKSTERGYSDWRIREALSRCTLTCTTGPIRGPNLASVGWSGNAAIALNALGIDFRNRNDLDVARTFLHSAMSLDRRTRGRCHPKMAHRLMNLACVELMRKQTERAERLLRRAWTVAPRSADITSARILGMSFTVALVQKQTSGGILGQLKTILLQGSLSNLADVDMASSAEPVVRAVESHLSSAQAELVRTLFSVVNREKAFSVLENCADFVAQDA